MNEKIKALLNELGLEVIKNEDGYFVDHGFAFSLQLNNVEELEAYLEKNKTERGSFL